MKRFLIKILTVLFGLITFSLISGLVILLSVYWYFSKDLPSLQELSEYKPPVISQVYTNDGQLIGQFAKERRLFTPIDNIPEKVSSAFIAAEDKNFYSHPGIDVIGIVRAIVTNITNIGSGKRMQGASTITQQVMKNFLLKDEKPAARKVKEAILAHQFEGKFSKKHILELYLNEIFLGAGAYGVTSAAQTYFNKKLNELEIHEIAYLAALPKGPNNYHPIRFKEKATMRRNYVITRMYEDGYITKQQMKIAKNKPLETILGKINTDLDATYFVEEIRRDLLQRYGESVLYNSGLMVSSTINPKLQKFAEQSLRQTLIELDRKLGWRGAIAKNVLDTETPIMSLKKYTTPRDLYDWRVSVVTEVLDNQAQIYVKEDNRQGTIPLSQLYWARTTRTGAITSAKQVLAEGDVVYVKRISSEQPNTTYALMQIPQVNGALMVMDPHTGRVLAQQGGFSFSASQFNRATQARRQPGSSFKPFVYAAALEQGYSPNTLVNDGPFYYVDDLGRPWQPVNYDKKYLGNVTLRVGLEKSRNLMTIRIAQDIGMENVIEFAERLGVGRKLQPFLPMSLGAGEVTLEEMVSAYATFANGGLKVRPIYFDRVQNRDGKTILTADIPACLDCVIEQDKSLMSQPTRLIDPVTNYQMISMLRGVVERGTGRTLHSLGVPIAGKTGTTNDSKDVWFMGFTSDLVFGTYIGYDNPKSMGKTATGGGTAAPMIKNFLRQALTITKALDFKAPKNSATQRVSRRTGLLDNSSKSSSSEENTIVEVIKSDQKQKKEWYDNKKFKVKNEKDYYKKEHINEVEDNINLGTGGLY